MARCASGNMIVAVGMLGFALMLQACRPSSVPVKGTESGFCNRGATENSKDSALDFHPDIQSATQQTLSETVSEFQARGGWAVVQEVKTGRILAMASCSNEFGKAANTVYEPGSLLKAITLAAAMNDLLVTSDTVLDAENGVWMFEGAAFQDSVRGLVSVRDAIQKSSTIVFAKIGLMLGSKRLAAYLRGFGFGCKLECGLSCEAGGILSDSRDWSVLKTARVGIGQEISVTALQMVNAYSCIANGGKLMRPYFTRDGRPEVIGCPLKPEVAREIRGMLRRVTEEGGTGVRASVNGYSVAGKTGNSQKAFEGGCSDTDYYASFAGFLPADDPVFCVIVTIDAPKPEHTGGIVAAPAFAKIASATAHILNLPPESRR